MLALERQKIILDTLKNEGAVAVSRLALSLDVTEETVRRDLEKLEKQEALIRTHGGAIPINDKTYELSLEKRKRANSVEKEKLAKEAVKHILPYETIFLDASTTTFYIARELKNLSNITVITNSIRVINELADYPEIKVIGVGGKLSGNQSFIGSLAEDTIKNNYFADKMFFSSKGITADGWVLESNEDECAIKQKMIDNSKEHFYLIDSSKIGRVGFVKLAQFEEIQHIITDYSPEGELFDKLNEAKVEILKL